MSLYREYIARANDGDIHAQYIVMLALSECVTAPKTEDDVNAREAAGLPAEFVVEARDRFQKCKPLREQLASVEAEEKKWRDVVKDRKHPLFALRLPDQPSEEKAQALLNAISQPYPEPFLYAEAFMEAARFYSSYPDRLNNQRAEAWRLLACASSPRCDSDKEREYLRTTKYPASQYEEIVALEAALRDAILRGDWRALGF